MATAQPQAQSLRLITTKLREPMPYRNAPFLTEALSQTFARQVCPGPEPFWFTGDSLA